MAQAVFSSASFRVVNTPRFLYFIKRLFICQRILGAKVNWFDALSQQEGLLTVKS